MVPAPTATANAGRALVAAEVLVSEQPEPPKWCRLGTLLLVGA